MEQARQKIADVLTKASCPAVLSSFGKDSMLLLKLAREVRTDFATLWFRTGQPEHFAKQVARDWNLTVYSYLPTTSYLLIGDESAVVSEYSFGSNYLPVISDVVAGEPCTRHQTGPFLPHLLPCPFDVVLVGWKDSDEHWIKGSAPLGIDGFPLGNAKLYAPLRHLNDAQVLSAIIELNVPYQPVDDTLTLCNDCYTKLPVMPIAMFRQFYGLREPV